MQFYNGIRSGLPDMDGSERYNLPSSGEVFKYVHLTWIQLLVISSAPALTFKTSSLL